MASRAKFISEERPTQEWKEDIPDPNAIAKHDMDLRFRRFPSQPGQSLKGSAELEEYIYSNDAMFFTEVLKPRKITRKVKILRMIDNCFITHLIPEEQWVEDGQGTFFSVLVPDHLFVEADPDLVPEAGDVLLRATWIQRKPFAKPGFAFPADSSRIRWEQIAVDLEQSQGESTFGVIRPQYYEFFCDESVPGRLSEPILKKLSKISGFDFELVARTGRTQQWFADLGSSFSRLYYYSGEVYFSNMQLFVLEDSKSGLGIAVGCWSSHPFISAPTFHSTNSHGSGSSYPKDFCSGREAMQFMVSAFQTYIRGASTIFALSGHMEETHELSNVY